MKSCYWISTDEPLLREEAADKLRAQARQQAYTRHVFHVDARFNWDEFHEQANSLSLFSDKKLIECRLQQGRLNDQGVKAINEYLEHKNADTCVLMISPKLEASAKKTKWFKKLEPQIEMHIIWPPQGGDFVQFLKQRARQYGLQLKPDALQLLAEQTEGNLLTAKQILQQLNLLHCSKELGRIECDPHTNEPNSPPLQLIDISFEQMQAQLHDASRFDVYQLVDTALAGNATKTVQVFYKLLEEDAVPTLILWALDREVTQLLKIQQAIKNGEDFSRLAGQYRIFGPRKALVKQALRRLQPETLLSMCRAFAQVDKLIKSQSSDDGINQLLDLYILLAGAKINNAETIN